MINIRYSLLLFITLFSSCSVEDAIVDDIRSKYTLSVEQAEIIRKRLPSEMRKSYIRYGEQFLGQEWPLLDKDAFGEYWITGNRTHFEGLSFAKRKHFAALVMGEIAEGNGRFIPDIIEGINSLIEEEWWGIPAHYNGRNIPSYDIQVVDLYNAETAGLVAWTKALLKEELIEVDSNICKKIDSEIEHRILQPAVDNDYWWKHGTSNWNPWICSNWITCVLFCEHDQSRRAKALSQIKESMLYFFDNYSGDGGCEEGIVYWGRSVASLGDCIALLKLAGEDTFIPANTEKLSVMGSYVYKMHIGGKWLVNFADSSPTTQFLHTNAILPFGELIGDDSIIGMGVEIAKENNFFQDPAYLFNIADDYPLLGRELLTLYYIDDLLNNDKVSPLVRDAWFPNLQVMTARTKARSKDGLFVAAKGGHNGESHNHNDVGNFILFRDGQPILIDVGKATYTRAYFSGQADSVAVWNRLSSCHNLPRINGLDQLEGKEYQANEVSYYSNDDKAVLSMDISGVYPSEAFVNSWFRTIDFERKGKLIVKENYSLKSFVSPSIIFLMSSEKPELISDGVISIGSSKLRFSSSQLSPSIETISIEDDFVNNNWGAQLYRIGLEIKGRDLFGEIKYSIE